MSQDFEFIEPQQERGSRPGFLTVLGILSFIAIGISLIMLVLQIIGGKDSEEELLDKKVQLAKSASEMKDLGMDSFAVFMEKSQAMIEQINDRFYLAISVSLITYVVGLLGVLKMWKGQKLGFHLYIVYCLLAIGGLYIYVSPGNVPSITIIINAILSGLFIFLYSRNLKWMR